MWISKKEYKDLLLEVKRLGYEIDDIKRNPFALHFQVDIPNKNNIPLKAPYPAMMILMDTKRVTIRMKDLIDDFLSRHELVGGTPQRWVKKTKK